MKERIEDLIERTRQMWAHKIQRWYLIIGAGIVLFVGFTMVSPGETENILYAETQTGDFKISVTEPGEIRAYKFTTVVTPRIGWSALTVTWLVDEGTTVKQGDPLTRFEDSEVRKRRDDALAELNILKAQLEKARANYRSSVKDAEANLESQELAFELSKIALEKSQYDAEMERRSSFLKFQQDSIALERARQGLDSRRIVGQSEIEEINLKIQQAVAKLQQTEDDLDKIFVKAPIDGLVVYEENWSTGRKIEKGSQLWPNQPIMQLPDLSAMQSTTSINEVDISKVKKDQPVVVKLDAYPQNDYQGVVKEVASVGKSKSSGSNAKAFDVVINITTQDSLMKPGMTTSNEIIIQTIQNAVYVPIEAVFVEEGRSFVFLKTPFGHRKADVSTGPKNENFVVITEGLSGGDMVALNRPDQSESNPVANTAGL